MVLILYILNSFAIFRITEIINKKNNLYKEKINLEKTIKDKVTIILFEQIQNKDEEKDGTTKS